VGGVPRRGRQSPPGPRLRRRPGRRDPHLGDDRAGPHRCWPATRNVSQLPLGNVPDFTGELFLQSHLLHLDTTDHIFVPPFGAEAPFGIAELTGFPDVVLVPDAATFRLLPWAEGTGWILADMHFHSGQPVPLSTRWILRQALERLQQAGYGYVTGLEVEFYITALDDPRLAPRQAGKPPDPPQVSAVAHGFQYLSETRTDEVAGILQALVDAVQDLQLPLRTVEDEWRPGQIEFTFDARPGLESADTMLLFRTAAKQVCRRHGYHATFMARPALPNFFSSGWHLHQSLVDTRSGGNAFVHRDGDGELLSDVGRHFVGGLLRHAAAVTAFNTPTINGYKRFNPYSLAPSKATWSTNRGAMIRVKGGPGDEATHLENRAGEPSANPYLYMASQVLAGIDGVRHRIDPGPLDVEPYEADRPPLPASLADALESLASDGAVFRDGMGDAWVDYYLLFKRSESERFAQHVTDWEHREYFEMY
jgi:glutamine synthetase